MPNQQLMTIGEVAELLNVGVRHIRRLVAERRIPYIKWGGLLRFDRDDINQWLDDSRSPTATRARGTVVGSHRGV